MAPPASITFLHLSDLQFGRLHLFAQEGVQGDAAYDTLYKRLEHDLLELRDQLRPDVVVLTGDLAEWGKPKEFEQVASFAARLGELLELERRRVLVVPGNHDINRKICESYFNECDAYDQTPIEPYWKKWECFHEFFVKFYAGIDDYVFREDQPWTLFELPDLELVVAGLNSTIAESHLDKDHYGKVGEKQLQWFAERLGQRSKWLRVGAVHHNPVRGEVDDDEHLHDAQDLQRILGRHLQLLLHGHRHQARVDWWGPRLPILATGSASVSTNARPVEVPNQYQFVRLERERLRWFTRMYARDVRRFVADTRHSADGNGWQHDEKLEFPQLGAPEAEPGRGRMSFDHEFPRIPPTRDTLVERLTPIIRARHREVLQLRSLEGADASAYLHVTASPEPGIVQQVLIAVVDGPLTLAMLETFRIRVVERYRVEDAHAVFEFVHRGGVDDGVRERAARLLIRIYSVAHYQGLPDLRPVVMRMLERLDGEQEYAPHLYVPQRMTTGMHGRGATVDDALAQVGEWLHTTDGVLALVLGEFGTGKTFLLRELARALGRAHLDGNGPLIPLMIEMRQLDRSHGLDDLLGQTLHRAGVERYDVPVLRHLIEQGHIVLLFDGFDELLLRVSYARAADHLDTVLRAAQGQAKVIISSRTQHFLRDEQATSLLEKAGSARVHLHVARVLGFDEHQIERFLINKLGEQGPTKLALMREIEDLVGLAHNPRLLGFIAGLDDELLRAAKQTAAGSEITPSKIYELLVERWLGHEDDRQHPSGSPQGVLRQDCEHALRRIALLSWVKTEPFVTLGELETEVRETLVALSREFDADVATHVVGSGTLLVRDDQRRFRFVHQSIMEWLVAREIAQAFARGEVHEGLTQRTMSPLSVGFLLDLADRDVLASWARRVLQKDDGGAPLHKNALAVRERLGLTADAPLRLSGRDLRGESLGGQLRGADLRGADLRGMRLAGVDLREADLRGARLSHAILDGADLRGAKLDYADLEAASLLEADLRGVAWGQTSLRRAALIGARVESDLQHVDMFGAATQAWLATCRTEHSVSGTCSAVACSPDGRLLATVVGAGIVVREFTSGREVAILEGHTGRVWSVAWSSDGMRLASGGEDGKVWVWDAEGRRGRVSLEAHVGRVWSVAWSKEGKLASGGEDGKVLVWDVDGRRVRESLEGHVGSVWSVAWSRPRTWGSRPALASGGEDAVVRVWDVASRCERASLRGHTGRVWSVAWSCSGALASGGEDGEVRVWDVGAQRARARLEGHAGRVLSVAWSQEGLASGGVALSQEELASCGEDGTVRVWDVEAQRSRARLEGHTGRVLSVAWSSESGLVSGGEDGKVRVWDVEAKRTRATLEGHAGSIWSVAWSSVGIQLASGGSDGKVRVWDAVDRRMQASLEGHSGRVLSVAWSTEGAGLVSVGEDGKVRVWDVDAKRARATLEGHAGSIWSVAWSSASKQLASGGSDGKVRLWDAEAARARGTLEAHTGSVLSVAWSSDDRLASAGEDGKVCVWDVEQHRVRASLEGHEGRVWSVAWSSSGDLASGGEDGKVWVWEQYRARASLEGHAGRVWSVAWSSDGELLASGGEDGKVRIYEREQMSGGFELRTAVEIPGLIPYALAFHPYYGTLWVSGSGGFTAILAGDTFEHRASLLVTDTGSAIFTPDGRYRVEGDIGEALWQRVGLHRFALGRLDPYLPHPARLPDDWRAE